jgi:hypothetical protein
VPEWQREQERNHAEKNQVGGARRRGSGLSSLALSLLLLLPFLPFSEEPFLLELQEREALQLVRRYLGLLAQVGIPVGGLLWHVLVWFLFWEKEKK